MLKKPADRIEYRILDYFNSLKNRSPYIVNILDEFQENEIFYYVMKICKVSLFQ